MTIEDKFFKDYLSHVLQWEGLTSSDTDDTASSCATVKGGIHTNKGVTYCTFVKHANKLGITPNTYNRFLALTDDDVGKFVFLFCQQAEASTLPTLVALSVTEAAWGSGPNRAIKHLQQALKNLGQDIKVDGDVGEKTLNAVKLVSETDLFIEYWKERQKFIDYLTSSSKYKKYKKGWNNRIKSFLKKFPLK